MIFVFTNNNLFLSEKYSSLVRISYKIYIRIKLLSINKKDIYIYICTFVCTSNIKISSIYRIRQEMLTL